MVLPAIATVPDKAAGDTFTEAMWDDYIKNNINYLIEPDNARVFNSSGISIAASVDTALTFDSETEDNNGLHDVTTGVNSRLLCVTPGHYVVGGHIQFAASTSGSYRGLYIQLNSSSDYIAKQRIGLISGVAMDMSLITEYDMTTGDYMQLVVFHDATAAVNVSRVANSSPEFWMTRVA